MYTYIQGSKELGAGKTRHLMATYNDNIRKHGISGRQGKIGNQDTPVRGSQSSDLKGIFPPVDVVRACYLEGYTLYYHSCSPWRFFVFISRQ